MLSLATVRFFLKSMLLAGIAALALGTPQSALAAAGSVSCPSGYAPNFQGGCYKLSDVSASNCPVKLPDGYSFIPGTCTPQKTPTAAAAATTPAASSSTTPAASSSTTPAANSSTTSTSSNSKSSDSDSDAIMPTHSSSSVTQTSDDTTCSSPIIFDCAKQTLTIGNGKPSTIACGDQTQSDSGVIGAPGKGAGSVFKSMKGAAIVNLVPPPCDNCVVHGIPPQNPADIIAGSSSHGCIHVNPTQLKLLSTCQGTAFQVKSNGEGGNSRVKKAITN